MAILNFLMLNVAGHPWSVTFAFGLWGAKIADFIGINVASWDFWNFQYPKAALRNSIFADHTSISNIGIILGALIASSLAGSFNNKNRIKTKIIFATMLGGFLWDLVQDLHLVVILGPFLVVLLLEVYMVGFGFYSLS